MTRRAGFTLIEVAVALLIVGTVAIAGLGALDEQMRAGRRGARVTEATALAQDRLAALTLFDGLGQGLVPDSLTRGTFAPPLDFYHWEAGARPVSDEPGLIDLSITVRWDDGAYTLRSRAFRRPRKAPDS